MNFRTEYTPRLSQEFLLDPEKPVLLMGSCFSDNIGEKMRGALWDARVNPKGVLFNPVSIADSLRKSLSEREVEVVERDGMFFSWECDSSFGALSKEKCVSNVRCATRELKKDIAEAQAIIITLGSSWVYELASQPGMVVANCHKFPASGFKRRMLSVEEVRDVLFDAVSEVSDFNKDLKFVFTVSPVRHVRDGFVDNSRSKATLLLGIESLIGKLGDVGIKSCYFPAFEIVNDDLRDYRFFGSDLVHPNPMAVEYIWEKFQHTFLDESDRNLLKEGESLVKGCRHRPLLPESDSFARFREKINEGCMRFERLHPRMLHPDKI